MVHLEPPRTVTLKSLDFIDFLAVLGEENDQEPQQKKGHSELQFRMVYGKSLDVIIQEPQILFYHNPLIFLIWKDVI